MGEQQPIMGNISAGELLHPFDELVYLPRQQARAGLLPCLVVNARLNGDQQPVGGLVLLPAASSVRVLVALQ